MFATPDQTADGPIPSQFLLTHERLDFFDFVAHPTNTQKTLTVCLVPMLLAIMWTCGEWYYIHKKKRDQLKL